MLTWLEADVDQTTKYNYKKKKLKPPNIFTQSNRKENEKNASRASSPVKKVQLIDSVEESPGPWRSKSPKFKINKTDKEKSIADIAIKTKLERKTINESSQTHFEDQAQEKKQEILVKIVNGLF